MTTIYNGIKYNFTQVSNTALLDVRLSSKAYKLYSYMCYRIGTCPTWQFNKVEILKHFKEGESALRSAFQELIKAGFLERKRIRNEVGKFATTDYTIYAEPVNTGSDPRVENPPVDKPHVVKPQVENQPYNNKDKNNKEFINKDKSFSVEEEREILISIWKNKNYKSDLETFILSPSRKDWRKKQMNLEEQAAYWENGFKKKNPEKYVENPTAEKGSYVAPVRKSKDLEAIEKVISDIKFAINNSSKNGHDYYLRYFHNKKIEKVGNFFQIHVNDKKAQDFSENLEKFNIKIKLV